MTLTPPTRSRSVLVLVAGLGLVAAGCGASASGAGGAGNTPAGSGSSAPPAAHTVTIRMADDGPFGQILETSAGSTLYLFTSDKTGMSVCTGGCAAVWPPLAVPAGVNLVAGSGVSASALSTISRSDGSRQAALDGHPLYRFAADGSAGQTKGEGVDGTWFLVASNGTAVKGTASVAPASPTPSTSSSSSGSGASSSSGGYGY
jgi:predicted lipoprotein with Yx(FWY)xxD motif